MKMALITSTTYGQGAEFVIASLARGFAERGHEVEIWVCKIQSDIAKAEPSRKPFYVPSNVRIRVMPSRRARYNIFTMRRWIKSGKFDCVMCHASNYAIPLALASVGVKGATKVINVVHSGGVGTAPNGDLIAPTKSIKSCIANAIYSLFDAQFAVSRGTAEAINRMTGYPLSRLYTVYNPVVDNNFYEKLNKAPQHKWLKDKSIPTFVAAGAFCRVKNYQMLIEAFARARSFKECRLVIFGQGPLKDDYVQLAKKLGVFGDIDFPGYTNQLPAEIKNAVAFVVSSYQESFSVVLVEALAAGVPVVATDCPYGPREILEDGKYGILVKNHDVEDMANGLKRVLAGNAVMPNHDVFSRFSVAAIIQRYKDALQTIERDIGH